MNEGDIFLKLQAHGVVAVLVIDKAEDAAPLAEALLDGGVGAMEITLRTPAALAALAKIRRRFPEMLAGIGTILFPEQVQEVVEAGAAFGVAPGLSRRVVEEALSRGLPFAPGICTPSDIEKALEYDRKLLKFFPAEPSGGLKYLQNIAAPYNHLGLRYMPLGGVSQANMGNYLNDPLVGAIGGSWLAPRDVIGEHNWDAIRKAALHAIAIRDQGRAVAH
ncbi:MAG: bifunctional 4-hydroxy-2-oxoglutarate aldolase/2-dehydro-3-deoxy-phosphogluconate aldolase [Verrucomicrobiales bacterium]